MSCPACTRAKRQTLYHLSDEDGETWVTARCCDCGFVYLWPRPTDDYLRAYYEKAAVYSLTSQDPRDYAAIIADKVALIRRFQAHMPPESRSGLAVDYGAGQGVTVKALSDLGYIARGIEISNKARAAAQALFGVETMDGDIEQFAEGSVSLLTMFDILEHLTEPKAFLCAAHQRLADGGSILIGVPNYNALDRILLGPKSKALIFPEHVNQFTRSSLVSMLSDCGFGVRYAGSPPPYGVAITFGLRRWLIGTFGRNALTLGLRDVLVWMKRWIVYPVPNFIVERTGLLGSSLLVVATKSYTA